MAIWKLKKGNFRWSAVRAYLLAIMNGFLYGAESPLVKKVPKKYLSNLDSLISKVIRKYFDISRGTKWEYTQKLLLIPKMEDLEAQLKVRYYKRLTWLNSHMPELKEATDFFLEEDFYKSSYESICKEYGTEEIVEKVLQIGRDKRQEICTTYDEPDLFSNRRLSGKKRVKTMAAITGEWDKRPLEYLKYCSKAEICLHCGGGRVRMICLKMGHCNNS